MHFGFRNVYCRLNLTTALSEYEKTIGGRGLRLHNKTADLREKSLGGDSTHRRGPSEQGNLVVLFDDQSKNIQSIIPYEVEFRLITPARSPVILFASHASDQLDYLAGEIRIHPPSSTAALPPALVPFSGWMLVPFNH